MVLRVWPRTSEVLHQLLHGRHLSFAAMDRITPLTTHAHSCWQLNNPADRSFWPRLSDGELHSRHGSVSKAMCFSLWPGRHLEYGRMLATQTYSVLKVCKVYKPKIHRLMGGHGRHWRYKHIVSLKFTKLTAQRYTNLRVDLGVTNS